MVRKQVYIEESQERILKQMSHALKVPEAALIRKGIDALISGAADLPTDLAAWNKIKKAALSRPAKPGGSRGWTRDEIYVRGKDAD